MRAPRTLGLVLATLLALAWPRTAHAQLSDSIAAVSAERYPYAKGNDPRSQLGITVLRANVGVPLFLGKKTILVPSLAYELIGIDWRGMNDLAPTSLHAPMLNVALVRILSDRWTLVLGGGVGFASDFARSVEPDDFVFTAMALGIYKISSTLSIGAGLGYDRRTGSLTPLPALPLQWRISERVRLRGIIPANLNLEYRPASWLSAGVRATFEGNRYHLSEEKFGAADLQLAYSVASVGPKLTFHLNKLMNLDLYASMPVYRRYAADAGDDEVAHVNLSPVVGYGVRLWIGPNGWDKPR